MATATTTTRRSAKQPATKQQPDDPAEVLHQLIDGLQENEGAALDAVKRFVDAVNDAVPDIGDEGPRQQIIDAAFSMTAQVVEASNRLAISVIDSTGNAFERLTARTSAHP